jgi:hypothetical protein
MRPTIRICFFSDGRRAVANLFLLALFAMVLAPLTSAAANPAKLPDGMFSTVGNQIVDQNQIPVRLSCVYWQGLNHQDRPPADPRYSGGFTSGFHADTGITSLDI